MFVPHAEHFAKLGFRTVVFDLPGHGSKMDEKLSYEAAIARVLDDCGPPPMP